MTEMSDDQLDISIHSAARAETVDKAVKNYIYSISIHSAARAETGTTVSSFTGSTVFQSTPPRGRRRAFRRILTGLSNFNPLRREGGDLLIIFPSSGSPDFNPLRREGGDSLAFLR